MGKKSKSDKKSGAKSGAKAGAKAGAKKKKELLEQMLRIRRFEERAAQAYGLRKIGGFCHLYIGQEAVAVGSVSALDLEHDYFVGAYRIHGYALACGLTSKECMAELFQKKTGCARGKGGSMHLFDAERHMLGGNGIVGAQIPTGAGVALKLKQLGEKGVCLTSFGDGAIHQGSVHETMNLAKIWSLPVIFLCENNHYGMGTAAERVSAQPDFYKMGCAHQIEGELVDGMDVVAVHEAFAAARKRILDEPGPYLIEARTYRYKGHSMSDPAKYRTKEELEEYKGKDPIERLKSAMVDDGDLSDEAFEKMDKTIKDEIEEAVQFAEDSDLPALPERFEDVYA